MKKRIGLFVVCLTWTFISVLFPEKASYAQIKPPDTFHIEHRWPADTDDPFGKYTITRIEQYLSEFPKEEARYSVIEPGDEVQLLTSVIYTYPVKYPVYINKIEADLFKNLSIMNKNKMLPNKGEYIYLLAYTGEGLYLAWYENQVLYVPGDGIQGLAVDYRGGEEYNNWGDYQSAESPKSDFWICLRVSDDKYGWVKYNNYKDWQGKYKGSIFYGK